MGNANDKLSKLLKKAINKHNAGKLTEAKVLYKKILSDSPQHLDANYLLGTLLAEEGDLPRALKQLNAAEIIAPQSHLIKNNLGNVYRMLGDFQAAGRYYEQALALKPEMPEACNNLAIVYRRLGKDDLAITHFERAISINPNFVEAIYNLGKCYRDHEKFSDAKACYQRALDIKSDYAPAHHDFGVCEMALNHSNEAIKHFQRYLELVPSDPFGARLKLAFLSNGDIPDKHPAQLVTQTYEKKARTWDSDVSVPEKQFLGPQHIAESIAKYCADSSHLSVLDIGCGTGLCGNCLRPHASQLIGVDISPHMLALAKQKKLYDELIESDIEDYLTQSQEKYDLIIGSGVLIFFGDLNPLLEKIGNRLREKGMLIATLYRSESLEISIRDNIHFAHSENHIRNAAEKNGLEVVELSQIVHEYEKGQPQAGFLLVLGNTGR